MYLHFSTDCHVIFEILAARFHFKQRQLQHEPFSAVLCGVPDISDKNAKYIYLSMGPKAGLAQLWRMPSKDLWVLVLKGGRCPEPWETMVVLPASKETESPSRKFHSIPIKKLNNESWQHAKGCPQVYILPRLK